MLWLVLRQQKQPSSLGLPQRVTGQAAVGKRVPDSWQREWEWQWWGLRSHATTSASGCEPMLACGSGPAVSVRRRPSCPFLSALAACFPVCGQPLLRPANILVDSL